MRRLVGLRPSAGTTWPPEVRSAIRTRDRWCVAVRANFPLSPNFPNCAGTLEVDHVRASGGLGLKSRSTLDNGVLLCSRHHRWRTEHGREARPLLLAYLERVAA